MTYVSVHLLVRRPLGNAQSSASRAVRIIEEFVAFESCFSTQTASAAKPCVLRISLLENTIMRFCHCARPLVNFASDFWLSAHFLFSATIPSLLYGTLVHWVTFTDILIEQT